MTNEAESLPNFQGRDFTFQEENMLIQNYVNETPKTTWSHKNFKDEVLFNKKSFKFKDQSQKWKNEMRNLGQQMKKKEVCLIYFVHGTFAGDAPLGFVKLFDRKYPYFGTLCKNFVKKYLIDKVMMRDCGNYTKEYVELFEEAVGNGILCKRPIWSSENNRVGRLVAVMELVVTIAKDIKNLKEQQKGKRILLQGRYKTSDES